MLIPFAGQYINPEQVNRVVYLPGKRLTIFLSDGYSMELRSDGTGFQMPAGVTVDTEFARLRHVHDPNYAVQAPPPPPPVKPAKGGNRK